MPCWRPARPARGWLVAVALASTAFRPAAAQPLAPLVHGGGASTAIPWPTAPAAAYVGVVQGLGRDSNVARAPDGSPAIADTVSTSMLLAGFDRSIGGQRIRLDASAVRNTYGENGRYDHTGYSADGALDYAIHGRVSGSVQASASERLLQSGQSPAPAVAERNMARRAQFAAVARVGTVTPLTIEAAYAHQRLGYSAQRYRVSELEQDSLRLDLLWRSSALLTVGAGLRATQGRYPFGASGAHAYTGRGAGLSVQWAPSPATTVSGRIGYDRTHHDDLSQRDFSGLTGNLQWDWQPTAKTRLSLQLARAGAEDAGFIVRAGEVLPASSRVSQATSLVGIDLRYLVTGKIALEGSWRMIRRAVDASADTAPGAAGVDDSRRTSLVVRYAALRSLQFACQVGREWRTSSTTLSYPYQARQAGCSAQLTLFP